MIVYLDTSALLKLYLDESGSATVQQSVQTAAAACTHLIAYTEFHAALTMAERMGRVSGPERSDQARRFETDWAALNVMAVDEALVRRAAEHARECGLRGYDSVHLAAAERACDAAAKPDSFVLAAFDNDLRAGAHRLGIRLLV